MSLFSSASVSSFGNRDDNDNHNNDDDVMFIVKINLPCTDLIRLLHIKNVLFLAVGSSEICTKHLWIRRKTIILC